MPIREKLTIRKVRPWENAASLKRCEFSTIVHLIFAVDQTAFNWIVEQLQSSVALEKIVFNFRRHFPQTSLLIQQRGFGKLSTQSLKRFRDKYLFHDSQLLDHTSELEKTKNALTQLHQIWNEDDVMARKLIDAAMRLPVTTPLTLRLMDERWKLATEMMKNRVRLELFKLSP